jgi:DNA-binding transcriptional LysR family regulator
VELRQLRHFEEIVRAASFGQAAERLHLTQPALSKSIRNLEGALGVQLFERHPSGVSLTEYGRVFLDYATLINSELARAVDHLSEMKGKGTGVVRVGAGATMMKYLMPETVRRFMAGDEKYSIVFVQDLRANLAARLRRGEIDVMIGSETPTGNEDLTSEPVLQDMISVVAAEGHPLENSRAELADLARYRWILPDTTESEGDRLAGAFRRAGLAGPDVAVRVSSSLFMSQWLRDGPFLSYLPRVLVTRVEEYRHLITIETAEPIWAPVPIAVFYRRKGVMLRSTRRFVNRVKEVGAEMQREFS